MKKKYLFVISVLCLILAISGNFFCKREIVQKLYFSTSNETYLDDCAHDYKTEAVFLSFIQKSLFKPFQLASGAFLLFKAFQLCYVTQDCHHYPSTLNLTSNFLRLTILSSKHHPPTLKL